MAAGKGATTVTVACKLPLGILIRGEHKVTLTEQTPKGPEQVTKWMPDGREFTVLGTAKEAGAAAKGPTAGGYVLTRGCPKALWDEWFEANKNSDMVKNRMIFAHADNERVRDQAKEQAELRSGAEPLDVSTRTVKGREVPVDPRFPRTLSGNLAPITTANRDD